MHGRRRDEYKARMDNPKVAAGLAQKAQQWYTLSRELVHRRRETVDHKTADQTKRNAETLALTEKLLLVNPDPLELWNHRRELLLLSSSTHQDVLTAELVLTASCLQRNPKGYGAWFHRKWVIRHYVSHNCRSSNTVGLLEQELALCAQFLKLDERNFHCWNYRRFVVAVLIALCRQGTDDIPASGLDGSWVFGGEGDTIAVMGAQLAASLPESTSSNVVPQGTDTNVSMNASVVTLLQSEWNFTTEKIEQNFSNFSAFHYRSKLLPLRLSARLDEDESRLSLAQSELETIVHNAIFTEPDDQTAWWYHRFLLLDWLDPSSMPNGTDSTTSPEEYESLLVRERDLLVELIETEDGQCKWGWLALHMVLTQLQEPDENKIDDCLSRLIELDPDRAARYESMRHL